MAAVEAHGKERKPCLVGWDLGKVVCSAVEVGKQLNGEEERELQESEKDYIVRESMPRILVSKRK